MHKSGGFTIVELIIVCIVIGILAGIVTAGWSASLVAGRDRTRQTEQQDWLKRFETYRQRYNLYPDTDDTGTVIGAGEYCLGTGFPSGRCKNISSGPSENATSILMTQLAKVGTFPDYKHSSINGYSGPWAQYVSGSPDSIRIYQIYESSDCPTNTTKDTSITGATACYVSLTKN